MHRVVGGAGLGSHLGQLFIELKPVEVRQDAGMRDSPNVISAIREALLPMDGIESLKFSEIQGGPGGADITVEITGEDAETVEDGILAGAPLTVVPLLLPRSTI